MFKYKKLCGILVMGLIAVLLSACSAKPTVDPNLKTTEIAATVQAELTQIALLTPSSTPTLEATVTPTVAPPTATVQTSLTSPTPTRKPTVPPSSSGDNSKFIGDVTFPDGTVVKPGEKFTKTWSFQNTGSTTWTKNYTIIYLEGTLLGTNSATSFNLSKDVAPGETIEVSAQFTAPMTNGRYTSAWKLYSAAGYPFGEYASIDITVGTPPTATLTVQATIATSPTISPTTGTLTP